MCILAHPTCTTHCKFICLIYQNISYNTNIFSLEVNMLILMMLELHPIFNHTYQAHIGVQIVHKLRKLQSKWKPFKKFQNHNLAKTPKNIEVWMHAKKVGLAKFWPYPSKKWSPTILERKFSCSQWGGLTCIHEWSSFFLFERGGGGGGGIGGRIWDFGVPSMFRMCCP